MVMQAPFSTLGQIKTDNKNKKNKNNDRGDLGPFRVQKLWIAVYKTITGPIQLVQTKRLGIHVSGLQPFLIQGRLCHSAVLIFTGITISELGYVQSNRNEMNKNEMK